MPIINQIVSGGGSVAEPYLEFDIDGNGKLQIDPSHIMDFTGVKEIQYQGLFYEAYANRQNVGAVDMSDVESIGQNTFSGMFKGSDITSIDLRKLKSVGTQGCSGMCENCTSLTTAIVGDGTLVGTGGQLGGFCKGCTALTSIIIGVNICQGTGSNIFAMCENCTSLTTASMKNFEIIQNNSTGITNLFKGCTSLKTQKFESLYHIGSSMSGVFDGCVMLESVWFYAANSFGTKTNQFSNMLSNCSNVTVHFPMAIQSTIGSWSDVTNGFGGTNTTVLFDIVTSLTGADTNTYTRSEKDSTATATAWVYNDTLYYTSGVSDNTNGVNEPSVGDTIYSDAACTVAVTTISAIA